VAKNKDSLQNTIKVAFLVCLACSIVVSFAAVSLKPIQKNNKVIDVKKNILTAAGLLEEGRSIDEQFSVISTKIVDLSNGKYSTAVDVDTYDQFKAAKDPKQSEKLASSDDIAGIKRLETYAKVYAVEENGQLETLILPIRGYGLWSTLYGFVALDKDLNTIKGLGFYQHAETPGLGGEVDNPKWKGMWPGKKVFDESGAIVAGLKKGAINPQSAFDQAHLVDGLSGATLTARGVDNLIKFWMGDLGFGPFLANLKAGEV